MTAVAQDADALRYASEELKNDPFLSRLSKIKSRGARLWLVHVRNAKFKDAYWRMVEAKAMLAEMRSREDPAASLVEALQPNVPLPPPRSHELNGAATAAEKRRAVD